MRRSPRWRRALRKLSNPGDPPQGPSAPSATWARLPSLGRNSSLREKPPSNWHALVGAGLAQDGVSPLSPAAAKLIWAGLAPTTRVTVAATVKSFALFCTRQGWSAPFFPADQARVLNWLAAEATRRGQSGPIGSGTLQGLASNLASWHVDLGFDPAPCSGPLVRRLLRGAPRIVGTKATSRALPITLPILRQILEVMRQKPRDFGGNGAACALRAACALAFACFLRPGEFTFDLFDGTKHLSWDCLDFGGDGRPATLRLKKSKTDTTGQGVKITIPEGPADVCPLRLLREWRSRSPRTDAAAPIFWLPGGNFPKRLVVAAVRRALTEARIATKGYSGHSFRRGAATWAKAIGMSHTEIQTLGRWSSDAHLRYADTPASVIADMSARCLAATSSSLPASGIPGPNDVWLPGH